MLDTQSVPLLSAATAVGVAVGPFYRTGNIHPDFIEMVLILLGFF